MFRSPARIALAVLVLSLVVGYLFAGGQLYDTFVGLDPSAFPAGQAIQPLSIPQSIFNGYATRFAKDQI